MQFVTIKAQAEVLLLRGDLSVKEEELAESIHQQAIEKMMLVEKEKERVELLECKATLTEEVDNLRYECDSLNVQLESTTEVHHA